MSLGESVQCLFERLFVQWGLDAASEDIVVDGRFWAIGCVEEHSRLEFDQWVGVLDVFAES